MVRFLADVIRLKTEDFTSEERNLLSVGFKNQIGSIRTAIRTISALETNDKYERFHEGLAEWRMEI